MDLSDMFGHMDLVGVRKVWLKYSPDLSQKKSNLFPQNV